MIKFSISGAGCFFRPVLALLAPASLIGAAPLDPNATYSGMATSYSNGGLMGACSIPISETATFYGAINGPQHEEAEWCGAWVEVTGPLGSAFVQIVEVCHSCNEGDLDLSPEAFFEITGDIEGRYPITWKWVSAPGDIGPIRFYSQGSNPYYLKLQAVNTVNPPAKMEILRDAAYEEMTRTADNFYVHSNGTALPEPFTIRVTDIFGNVIVTSGLTISGTATGQSGSGNFPAVGREDIVVEDPGSAPIADTGSFDFGTAVDNAPETRVFTVRNLGSVPLTGLSVLIDGSAAAEFSVLSPPASTVAVEGSTSFSIRFSPSIYGVRSAAIHLLSSSGVTSLASYDINLRATSLSTTIDTDEDGLNDAAEGKIAALGFDWQTGQAALVGTLLGNAETAGLYTSEQIQKLHLGTPLLSRDPVSGTFQLQLGLSRSSHLEDFQPFPFSSSGISVLKDGKLQFDFSSADDAAFFQIDVE